MKVKVETIVSERPFGMILRGRVLEVDHAWAGQSFRIRAPVSAIVGRPVPGETWSVEGDLENTTWGLQIAATRVVRVAPSGRLIKAFLAANVPGIGPERAEALWSRFGMELGQLLDDEGSVGVIAETLAPDRPLLGPRIAASCIAAWRAAKNETLTVGWLASRGIEDVGVARVVLKVHGEEAVARLTENPYSLVPLLTWARVDRLGLQLLAEAGAADPRTDRRRVVGAVDEVVKRTLKGSATAIAEVDLRTQLARLLGAQSAEQLGTVIAAGVANLALVSGPPGVWRAPGAAAMEDYLTERFEKMLGLPTAGSTRTPVSETLPSLLDTSADWGLGLHPEQREAVVRLLSMPLACLTGGAGVGKTTVTRTIADLWEKAGEGHLVLCALAGKAALRLSQATGRSAMTIARLLHQLRRRKEIERNLTDDDLDGAEKSRLLTRLGSLAEIKPTSLVIVDEASMVDLASLYNLVRLTPEGARFLLVGDEGQLPPVSFGILFHRLVRDSRITSRLSVVHRQTEAGGIPAVARAIRQLRKPVLPDYAGLAEGVTVRRCAPDNLADEVEAVWRELGGSEAGTMVLAPTWEGEAGVRALNERLQGKNAVERQVVKGHLGQWFSECDPVIFLRNDYRRGLFNRTLGRVLEVNPAERRVVVQFDGFDKPLDLGTDDLIDIALAYAITVHSAQGSQAPAIVLPLYRNRLLDPSLIYTAVTRAERQVVFVGDESVIDEALAQPPAAETRLVAFSWGASDPITTPL